MVRISAIRQLPYGVKTMEEYINAVYNLPDFPDTEKVEVLLVKFVSEADSMVLEDAVSVLQQLAERWETTYQDLDNEVRKSIEGWVQKHLDMSNPSLIKSLSGPILVFGLKSVWTYFREYYSTHQVSKVLQDALVNVMCYPKKGIDNPVHQLSVQERMEYDKQRNGWSKIDFMKMDNF